MSSAYIRWFEWTLYGSLWQRWLKQISFFLPAFLIVQAVQRWQAIAAHRISLHDFLVWPVMMALGLGLSFAFRFRREASQAS